MKVTDIIRAALEIIEKELPQAEPVQVVAEPEAAEPAIDELVIITQLAGTPAATEPDYANEPCEVIAPTAAAYPAGDDMHYSKNSADIRTNAPSMYPNYQAEK